MEDGSLLTGRKINKILWSYLKGKAGYLGGKISRHSFRAGLATAMTRAGCDEAVVKVEVGSLHAVLQKGAGGELAGSSEYIWDGHEGEVLSKETGGKSWSEMISLRSENRGTIQESDYWGRG